MKDDFARGKCPICGCDTMFRMNKNRILYTFCRNGHHAKLGRDDSIVATAKISGGQNWNNGIVYLYPLTKGKENEKTGTTAGTTTGTTSSARTEFERTGTENGRTVSGTTSSGICPTGTNRTTDDDGDWGGWL